jgi:hypothetical protein
MPFLRFTSLIATPERSIIVIASWPPRAKLVVFSVAYALYWALGFVVHEPGIIAWRLSGFFVPVFAALVWGGLAGLGIFLLTSAGIYALLALRGIEFLGGAAGPLTGIATMTVIGLLRHYIMQLHAAQTTIATLEGIIPICASCKKVRDDDGYWHQVEAYVESRSGAQFTHGLCPDCARDALRALNHS